jgi:response regulator RpfG family c-di-GMP phosphodiesterase
MIIVVDDEPDILQYMREILRHVNYEVITATSGDQAWTLFEEYQPDPISSANSSSVGSRPSSSLICKEAKRILEILSTK